MEKILIVDDERNVHYSFRRVLGREYELLSAFSGNEALEKIDDPALRLILMDVRMPNRDGLSTLEEIKRRRPALPVIMMTAFVSAETAIRSTTLDADDYLVKPFTKRELDQRIDSAMSDTTSEQAPAPGPSNGAPCGPEDDRPAAGSHRRSHRRQSPRVRTLKSAQIIYNNSNCVIDGLVLNISDTGAAVQPADFIDLPETFLLKVYHGPTYRCQVRWRHGNKIGVCFLNN